MSAAAKPKQLILLALSLMGTVTLSLQVSAQQYTFEQFSKAPTFTAPAGCVPQLQNYGVLSRCEMAIEPGRTLVVLINTSMGFLFKDTQGNDELFVRDHVAEIKAHWGEQYASSNLTISSWVSDVVPENAPPHGISCLEYSITAESPRTADQQPLRIIERREGLTCAWRVDKPKAGAPNLELFWLEAFYEYTPSIGQTPLVAFDQMVRALYESVRL